MIFRAVLTIVLATASIAAAQAPGLQGSAGEAPADPAANTVAGVIVGGGPPPRMSLTFPASDGETPPGVLVVKVTFDQPMKPDAFGISALADTPPPDCLQVPRQLGDRKTFVLLCSADGGKRYGLAINAPGENAFLGADERRAAPFELRFSTAQGEPVRTVRAAMKNAGLGELDLPIEAIARNGAEPPAAAN